MSEQIVTAVVSVLIALVGLAIIATLVSKNAATSNVLAAGSQGFSNSLLAATSPVGGGGFGGLQGLSFSGGAL